MDPALKAAYEQGFASAAARRGSSRVLSTTASTASAAVQHGSTLSAQRQLAATGSMSISTFARGLLTMLWRLLLAILALFWTWLLRPLLICGLVAAAVLLLINIFRITDWLGEKGEDFRDWYDDVALNNDVLLKIERGWASFKRAMTGLGLMLRYNWYMDQLRLLRQEIRLFYDRVMGNWRKILLLLAITAWFTSKARQAFSSTPEVVLGWPGFENLPPRLAGKEPAWVHTPRKWEGSNSHYRPEPEQHQPVPWQDWVEAVGGDQSVRFDSSSPETVTFTETERVTETETSSITHTDTSSITRTETSRITHTHRVVQTSSDPETPTDYWAPPKGKRVIQSEEAVWCRECQQFHCCELPH
ncbi:hypothetical protein LTR36_002603 [Oleoguttula mirabilis]|uniref:Uncharacterized protein n=1 Tax=Oleoguttula mirabilis TaxID=1507867 RepID=A0AAV9JJR9_9PEZI|nr:hypothetical protein LTR36_002603 [Oleoguttula mirabilis]